MPAAPQRTSYASHPVSIPAGFLEDAPAKPVTVTPIRWSPALPEYEGAVAAVLDNVLSPEECAQLLCLAESSVVLEKGAASPWRPALVSAGAGWEVPIFDYRNSDRIVWDQQTIVNRLWDRCRQGRGVEALFGRTPADRERGHLSGRWVFERVNERMRFLKYSPGQFFRRKWTLVVVCFNTYSSAVSHADRSQRIATDRITIGMKVAARCEPTTRCICI